MKLLSIFLILLCPFIGCASGEAADNDCARTKVDKVERPNVVWQPGATGTQIALWPDSVEIEPPDTDGNAEMIGSGSPLIAGRTWNWATYVTRPTMTVYPAQGENTGVSLLVLPGGGYAAVAMDLEGTEICDWITQHGVTCVLLKYRAPQVWERSEDGVQIPPDKLLPLEDAQRAMRLLRNHAVDYEIDPNKIGVIGFSAGAHLAAVLSNTAGQSYKSVDNTDTGNAVPNFAILLYPGRFLPPARDTNSLELAPWMKISAKAPPTLLVHAMNDAVNDVRNTLAYALALKEVGVAVDLRIFAKGCHAFGLRPTSDPITQEWPELTIKWLKNLKMM